MTMHHLRLQAVFVVLLVSLFLAACGGSPGPGPTGMPSPSAATATLVDTLSPTPTPVPSPTRTLTPSSTATSTPTRTPTPSPSPSFTPTPSLTASPTPSLTPTGTPTPSPTLTPTPTPSHILIPTPTPISFVYGRSAGGRDLIAWRFGRGPAAVALIGGVHGGLEWNTTELVAALRDHLLAEPRLLPNGVRLILIPLANPDGAAAGVGTAGRVNARGADLAGDWNAPPRRGDKGFRLDFDVLLQPENRALRDLLLREGVWAVVFYHSFDALYLHGGVFPGRGRWSASLAAAMGQAIGYPLSPPGAGCSWGGRPVGWLAAKGMAAVDVHLPDRFGLDWEANLAGLSALVQWVRDLDSALSSARPSLTPEATPASPWSAPSPLYGNLVAGYPLTVEAGRFTLHYQPGTPADGDAGYLVEAAGRALAHVEETLGVGPAWHFDLYIAGTPFAYPGETSRGYSMSWARRIFYRYDGTGPLVEFESGLAHELTHLMALNEFGPASSSMISEGLAVAVQWPVLEAAGWLTLDAFCAGMASADALPSALYLASDEARYWGYMDQDNYMASACFVAFLADRWGMEAIARLYHSADWAGVTGLTLVELDALWAGAVAALADEVAVDGAALVELEAELGRAYAYLAAHVGEVEGGPAGWALDGLRVTWRMGRFDRARAYADEFRALTTGR